MYTRLSVQRAKACRVGEAPSCALWLAAHCEQAVTQSWLVVLTQSRVKAAVIAKPNAWCLSEVS